MLSSTPTVAALVGRLRWLIGLRWVFIAGVVVVVAWATSAGAVRGAPLLVITAALALLNLVFTTRSRRLAAEVAGVERELFLQLLTDAVALGLLLHWSDGIENPFSMLYAFQVAIAGRLLSSRRAWVLASVVVVLNCGTILLEHLGVIAHHRVHVGEGPIGEDSAIESAEFLAAYVLAFCCTIYGTVFFMVDTASRARAADAERVRVEAAAFARERLATLGELSAGVAHSFGNPVHGLLNCGELLRAEVRRGGDPEPLLELMDEALHRIQALTHRLLAYARDAPLQARVIDLREVADETVRMCLVAARPITLSLQRRPGEPVPARIDPDRVGEALSNIVANALHACRAAGEVEVVVRRDGTAPVIAVEDHGVGIPREVLDRVCDPFFTTKPLGEGTGLGLAIARRIMEEHGGSIRITSDAGLTVVALVFPPVEQDVHGGAS